MYCKARSRNWQLQLIKPNRRYRPISVQLFDWQETSQLWLQTQCRRQNSLRNDRRRPWRTVRDDDVTDTQQLQRRRDPT